VIEEKRDEAQSEETGSRAAGNADLPELQGAIPRVGCSCWQ
jgi:hypothetical protein